MNLPPDIERRIAAEFADPTRARAIIMDSSAPEVPRLIRCAVQVAGGDYDALTACLRKAHTNPKELISWAEYDNRSLRQYDFQRAFDDQVPYSYSPE